MTNIEIYKRLSRNISEAEEWQTLPLGKTYQKDRMAISLAHCKAPKLQRAGQQFQGGQNYWDCPIALETEALNYLVKNWNEIYPQLLKELKRKAADVAIECQSEIDKMQKIIDASKQRGNHD